jgi:uncharacterized membrane protein
MEKYLNNMKTLIKFAAYGIVLVLLLNVVAGEILRLLRLTVIPMSWAVAVVVVVAFKGQLMKLIKKLDGGKKNETD